MPRIPLVAWRSIALLFIALGPMSAQMVVAQTVAPKTEVKIDGSYGFGMPPDISTHGHRMDQLITVIHWFMGVLFFGWGIFFLHCLFKFRQRAGHRAEYQPVKAKFSKYAEVGVAIFEAVLLLSFSMPIWASVKNDIPTEKDNPIHLRVLAEQFAWNFHYSGKDGVFGRTAPQFVNTATNQAGKDPDDAHGKDDIVAQEMHIPVNRKIICDIASKDVIHSFFLPVLRVKQDAIPGMRIPVWFEATKTGTYEVACAQLCGNNHYSMRALLVVEPEDQYNAWLAEKAKGPGEFED